MRSEYIKLIASVDKLLHEYRTLWLGSRGPQEGNKWMNKINEHLDERIGLMKCRDALIA